MAQVLLSNDKEPVGVVLVTLPIPDKEYAEIMDDLRELGIGDVTARDCYVDQIMDAPPVLDCLEGQTVNIDELDFLFRSIDRYADEEMAKFQSMATKLELKDVADLINLSFCCERATVITDFSDLESVGKRHYMTMNGGSFPVKEYDSLNGVGIARNLIAGGGGTVTPYGVVYDNGMQLEPHYTGWNFPAYADNTYLIELELGKGNADPNESPSAVLFLPMPEERLKRLIERAGFASPSEVIIRTWCSDLPDPVNEAMYIPREDILQLNSLCEKVLPMDIHAQKALSAAVLLAQPVGAYQLCKIAKEMGQFEFIPGVNTPEEYGRYMIQQSDRYEYDPELEGFYDYKKYGESHIRNEGGQFMGGGYICFKGDISMEELMMEPPSSNQVQQGGMEMMGF